MRPILIFMIALSIFISGCTFIDDIHKKMAQDVTVQPTYLETGVFVSVNNGNDSNAGTNRGNPVKTIQVGISNAVALGFTNVYVDNGVYIRSNGLNNVSYGFVVSNTNLRITGGYGPDFNSQRAGYSMLNGTNMFTLISVYGVNVYIEGFMAYNAYRGGDVAGYSNRIVDVAFSNNGNGGGLNLNGVYNQVDNCVFCFNKGNNFGGGLYMGGANNTANGLFYTNGYASSSWGGGVCIAGSNNTLSGVISNNYSTYYGGGVLFYYSYGSRVHNAKICNNYANRDGGGIRIFSSTDCIVSNSFITHNMISHTQNYGSGVYLQLGYSNTVVDCVLYGNQAVSNGEVGGGCFTINGSDSSRIYNCVITNNFSGDRDAVFALDRLNYDITGLVISNNLIGGTNGSYSIGIYEYNGDTTSHVIRQNRFVSNSLGYLYWNNGGSPVVTNNAGWTNINNTAYSGAAMTSGNINN